LNLRFVPFLLSPRQSREKTYLLVPAAETAKKPIIQPPALCQQHQTHPKHAAKSCSSGCRQLANPPLARQSTASSATNAALTVGGQNPPTA
jgi:hypothetical protein